MVSEYANTLQIILKIGTSISIITSIIDIILYWFFPQNRNFSFNNIIILAIINLIYSISTLLPSDLTLKQPENTTVCQIQSFMINFSHCAQYLQVLIISYCVFIKLITRNHLEQNHKMYRAIFFLFLIIFPLVFSIYIIITKSYGSSVVFCWINIYTLYKKNHIKKVVLNYYISLWFLLIINIFFVVKIKVMMRHNKIKNEIYQHLLNYPIIMVVFSIPGTFNAIYRVVQNNKDVDFMLFLQVISESSFGFVLNIYFITSPWIKQSIVGAIKNQNTEEFESLMPIREVTRFSIFNNKDNNK
jgi:hypothetical protein